MSPTVGPSEPSAPSIPYSPTAYAPTVSPDTTTPATSAKSQPSAADTTLIDNTQVWHPNGEATNSQSTNVPLLPMQGVNSSSIYSSPNSSNAELSAPSLYNTGKYDLGQVASANALSQAFSGGGGGAAGFFSEAGADYEHGPIERIRLGPVDIKTTLNLNFVADDNIQGGSNGTNGKESDVIFGVTPAILVQYGAHEGQRGFASLVYAPTFSRYYHHPGEDTQNQNVALNVQYPFQKLTVNVTQTYTQSTGINTDTQIRTTQTTSVSSAGLGYNIDDKLSVNAQAQQVIAKYSGGGGQGDTTTTVNTGLVYAMTQKISFGPSVILGYDQPDTNGKQKYEQGLIGINYQPTQKIGLTGQAGVELRQYDVGGNATNPIFSGGISYRPFDSTVLGLDGHRSVETSSATSLQTDVNTGISANITQRFLQRFYFSFSFSYDKTEYSAAGNSPAVLPSTIDTPYGTIQTNSNGSSQENFVYRPSFSYSPTQWTSIAIYYEYRADESSDNSGQSYHDNQMGLSLSAQF